jgi:radical SAM protein with 4Fe4S-binding SPASM domain
MAAPHLISWNLTRRCNLACGHCYLDAVQRKSDADGELTLPEVAEVIDQIAELAPGAMLVLTGGEPLLRRDLDDIVEHAAGHGLMPVIGTNGILLSEERARRLRDAGAAGAGISVDSITSEFHDRLRGHAGAWRGAFEGMRAARAAGLGVLMQATLFEENRHQLAGFADLAAEVGAMALNFFFLVCTGRGVTQTDLSPQTYEETLREVLALQGARPKLMIRARCAPYARRMLGLHAGEMSGSYAEWSSACLAGRRYLRIGPKGDVTPCPYIPEGDGNLRWKSLRDIWDTGPSFVRLRNEMPEGKCGQCDYRVSCGGCRARALATEGNLMAEDAKCTYIPAYVQPEVMPARECQVITWTADAQQMVERIPSFIRGRIKSNLEQKAKAEGQAAITVEFMNKHKPAGMPFARPGAN